MTRLASSHLHQQHEKDLLVQREDEKHIKQITQPGSPGPASCKQMSEHSQPQQNHQATPRLIQPPSANLWIHGEKKKICCFKLLSFGVICYITVLWQQLTILYSTPCPNMMQELGCFSFYFYRLQNLKMLNIAPMHDEEKNLQLILEMFPKSS